MKGIEVKLCFFNFFLNFLSLQHHIPKYNINPSRTKEIQCVFFKFSMATS